MKISESTGETLWWPRRNELHGVKTLFTFRTLARLTRLCLLAFTWISSPVATNTRKKIMFYCEGASTGMPASQYPTMYVHVITFTKHFYPALMTTGGDMHATHTRAQGNINCIKMTPIRVGSVGFFVAWECCTRAQQWSFFFLSLSTAFTCSHVDPLTTSSAWSTLSPTPGIKKRSH